MCLFHIRWYFADLISFQIIVKMADFESDVEFKNDKHCAYDENNWRLTLTAISLRRFGALRPL